MAEDLLLHAAQRGDLEEAGRLLSQGLVSATIVFPPSKTTPLHAACRSGGLDIAEMLLHAKANPNLNEATGCGGRTPLHVAAARERGAPALSAALLRAGASPVVRDAQGATPLHAAAQAGHADVTRLLLAQGADPHLRDWAGFNAAWWAKEYRHREVLDVYAAEQIAPSGITARMAMQNAGPRARSVLLAAKGGKKKSGGGKSRSASASARKR
mmetsp:Transcript_31240/g.67246  ORF Transcript_31240/g.67246 Transcript_31240/m.67246 type:complete len:213 (-) Transcript_31240:194-832(-)|eukprot:CAMPEP_0206426482 /NCGR_PEP_ID=MMETSP0324_2-20121206/4397_1 /ASSEMBLY_ACC=CAM_ASM_000836 /TAXON_ID=2866 /ORGANISM="Crypthecodinium cohnii, Strain Seligo" /LENGTH=212 /DNA_ID=CAMNT_0053891431 /DNA_START=83 /DNA_END=721 /DNA_ORIENTATION=-